MAKQYHRRQSGLIVADDAIAVPNPDLPRPWYAGKITANRGMSRRKCCCSSCKCGETTITADGTVTWISHTVADGVITRVENESPCITYYVDSVSGGGAESGTGTELDPWTNLNTVFSDTCIYTICNGGSEGSAGCPMVKVLVKGTIDYSIGPGLGDYHRKLVIEAWGESAIAISVSSSTTIKAVDTCVGVVWKRTNPTANVTLSYGNYGYAAGFCDCTSSIFNECNSSGNSNYDGESFGNGYGFRGCSSSSYESCTGTGISNDDGNSSSFGFRECSSSTFRSTSGTGTSNGGNGYGFHSCGTSVFDTCDGTGSSLSGYGGFGFASSGYSTFRLCVGAGDLDEYSCGFYGNNDSSFLDCTANPSGEPCDI